MNYVEAIKDVKQIDKIKKYLIYKDSSYRNHALFVVGINSGLMISDLLSLKVSDVLEGDLFYDFSKKLIKNRISLKDKKTGKIKDFPLSDTAKEAIYAYLQRREHMAGSLFTNSSQLYYQYLFPSKKGGEPLSRVQAYRILTEAAKVAGIQGSIGTHTLRKTFGYHAYIQCKNLSLVAKLLNHSSEAVTLRYIGITREDLDNVYLNLNL